MMVLFSQDRRTLRVHTPLGDDVLFLARFTAREALSRPFVFGLELVAESYRQIAFERILGQSVTVEIELADGSQRFFNGIVRRFSEGRRDETFTHFEAELVPELWFWTKRVGSRVFQGQTVPDILRTVLTGVAVDFELTSNYPAHNYCVQYRESDLAFAHRMMEEEGIFYYFDHSSDGHTMKVVDDVGSLRDLTAPSTVVFEALEGGSRGETRIRSWTKTQAVAANKFTLWDHSFQLPSQHLDASEQIPPTVKSGAVEHQLVAHSGDLEIFDYPGEYAHRFDGIGPGGADASADLSQVFKDNGRTTTIRMQEEAAGCLTLSGGGNCVRFLPGYKFNLARHFDGDGNYLITEVVHEAKLSSDLHTGDDASVEYVNRFACIPDGVAFRPRRVTPRPRIDGIQTATVVGPAGQPLFCDKYGRVKVQFHWDRFGRMNADSSCWVRVGQIWAGTRWGALFLPRVGHEVIVAFEDGDPDRPMITGSVYNAANMPPWSLPDQLASSGIKSCSLGGEPSMNFNGIVFHDQMGNEHTRLHSERRSVQNSESVSRQRVGVSHCKVVGRLFPSGGSGSGGGDSGEFGEFLEDYFTDDYPGEFETTFGNKAETVIGLPVGLNAEAVYGGNVELVVDPFGFLGYLVGRPANQMSGWGWVDDILFGTGGELTLVFGRDTYIVYGVKRDVHRGSAVKTRSPGMSAMSGYAMVLSALISSLTLAAAILEDVSPDETSWENTAATWGMAGAVNRLVAILASLETAAGELEAAEGHVNEGEAHLNDAEHLDDGNQVAVLDGAENHGQQGAQMGEHVVGAGNDQAANEDHVVAGNYTLQATGLTLRGATTIDPGSVADVFGPMLASSFVTIDAQGSNGGADENGWLRLSGSKQATMQAGPASVQCSRIAALGNVVVDAGETGMITIKQGLPDEGARITLTPEGITLAYGPPGAGASINLGPEGIILKYGEWTQQIVPEGIIGQVAENVHALGPQGLDVDLLQLDQEVEVEVAQNQALLDINVDGVGAINAALNDQGPG